MAANIAAGLGAGLTGGLKAFQNAQAIEEEKRQFDAQQDHQRALLARALTRDELEDERHTQQAEDEKFKRDLLFAQQGFKTPISEETRNQLHPLVREGATKLMPQATAPATLMDLDGSVLQRGQATPGPNFYQFGETETERARIAAAQEAGRAGRSQDYGDLQRELTKTRGDQATALANLRGDIGRDIANIRVDAANARFNAMPMLIQTVDAQGNPTTRVAMRGSLNEGQEFASKPTAEQINRKDARGKATKIFDTIDRLSARINVNQGIIAKAVGGVEKAKAQANLNDDVAGYEAMISGFTPLIARAVGHVGVLTEQDVQSVRALFPAPGDSKSLRDRKIAQIKYLMNSDVPLSGPDNPNVSFTDVLNGAGLKPLSDAPAAGAAPTSKFRITKVQ